MVDSGRRQCCGTSRRVRREGMPKRRTGDRLEYDRKWLEVLDPSCQMFSASNGLFRLFPS